MTRNLEQGLLNVLIEHHPKIGDIIFNYLKVMFKIPKIAHLPSPEESRKDSCSPDSKQSFQDRLYFQSWVMPKPLFHSSRPTEMQSGVSGTLFRQKTWWAPECSTLRQLVLTCLDQDSYASKPSMSLGTSPDMSGALSTGTRAGWRWTMGSAQFVPSKIGYVPNNESPDGLGKDSSPRIC